MLRRREPMRELHPPRPLGVDWAPRLLLFILVPLSLLRHELCCILSEVSGSISAHQEKFEIPFLEKNVPPRSLIYTAGFWSMQWVSVHGDEKRLVGILFWDPALEKSCWGEARKRPLFFFHNGMLPTLPSLLFCLQT